MCTILIRTALVPIYLRREINIFGFRFDLLHSDSKQYVPGAPNRGGLGGLNPPEFWMGVLNTCQPPPPLILRNNFLEGVGSP